MSKVAKIIGFDGSRAFVKEPTGTENYSFEILSHLAKIDSQNLYKVFLRPNAVVSKNDWPKNFEFIEIPYPRLWTQVGLATQTFRTPIDVLFVTAHTLPIIKKPGLKTIMTVHDLGAEYLPKMHQFKQQLYLNWMTHHQLATATKLIAVSKSTKHDLIQKAGINPSKISVIYEGYNPNLSKFVKNDTKVDIMTKFDIKKRQYFIFVGTIQPRKNLILLIEAFSKFLQKMPTAKNSSNSSFDDFKLVLAGGKGWLADEIYEAPKKFGVESQVKFIGRVSDQEKMQLYQNARALTFPSLYEGFGLPVLEAFLAGCPVIASNSSSLPEVVGDAGLLIDPRSAEDLSETMFKVSTNDDLRVKLKGKGLEQLKKFSWEKAAKETLNVLNQI